MSEEYSFEELRAKYRGWLDYDWSAIRQKEQEQAQKAAEATSTAKAPKPKAASLVFKDPPEQTARPQTVPLKGSIDDEAANDENMPPSQVDIEKAKAAKKAKREERANRTRKIKVMDVKEIRGETQTSRCMSQARNEMVLMCNSTNKSGLSCKAEDSSKADWS